MEFVSNVYRENQNTVVQCNIRDITERKQSDERLAVVAAKNEHIVEVLQRSMLQTISPRKFAGILVETLYQAALNEAEVGGDFFDAFSFGGDKEALVIGDVSGKGLLAASRTAEVKYALRAFLHEYCSPEIALAHLNDFIFETHRLDNENQEMFIVVSLIVIENSSGRALFVSAGAEATIILRADGTSEQVIATGTPLGIIPSAEYMVQSTILRYGDTVLMVTDGITEARKGNMFLGVDGLQSLVEQMGSSISLSTLGAAVYLGAKSFANGDIRDDVCMLLARKL